MLLAGVLFGLVALGGCAAQPEAETTKPTTETTTTTGGSETATAPPSTEQPVNPETVAGGNKPEEKPVENVDLTADPKNGEDVAIIDTAKGRIVVMFYPQVAPKHVENFKMLVGKKFYDGTRFHRCIADFMIQGGDPNSRDISKAAMWGQGGNMQGGQEVNVKAEFNMGALPHKRGVLSMARSGDPDSASSQFFIMHQDNPGLDGQYSAFGRAVSGLDVVDKIVVTGDAANNGSVKPADAVVVRSIRMAKWPVK